MRSLHHSASPVRLARASALVAMLCVAAFSGCAGVEDLSGTGGASGSGGVGVVGGGGGSSQSSTLVGQWTRALLVGTPDGDIHESRTTWEFRADHSGIRSVTAWNWTTGVYDTIYDVAQWSTSGSTITIVYIAGTTGTLTLSYRIDGDVLTMGPDQFARVR